MGRKAFRIALFIASPSYSPVPGVEPSFAVEFGANEVLERTEDSLSKCRILKVIPGHGVPLYPAPLPRCKAYSESNNHARPSCCPHRIVESQANTTSPFFTLVDHTRSPDRVARTVNDVASRSAHPISPPRLSEIAHLTVGHSLSSVMKPSHPVKNARTIVSFVITSSQPTLSPPQSSSRRRHVHI